MNKIRKMIWSTLIVAIILGAVLPKGVNAAGNDQPRIMVTDYAIEEEGIIPGETAKLTITLKNMNTKYSVYSVLVTCQSSSEDVSVEYGTSNQAYIDTIAPGEQKEAVISLQATDTLAVESVRCNLNISYQDDASGTSSTDTVINLPVKQDYLKIQRAYVPQTAVVDVNSRVSVTYENITSEELYNAVMIVKGSGMKDTSVNLGTILSGNRKNQEVYITFDALGEQSVSAELTYEDAKGKSYKSSTQSYQVEVAANEQDNLETGTTPVENTIDKAARLKQAGCAVALVLCLIGSLVIVYRGKKH